MARREVRVDVKTTGDPSGARTVDDALDAVEESARRVEEALDKTDGLPPQAEQSVRDYSKALRTAAAESRKAQASMGAGSKSAKGHGLAILEVSRAYEDLQFGIRGVLNNIPGMIFAFGGGAGLAGAISLAAVAANQLFRTFEDTEEKTDQAREAQEAYNERLADMHEEIARGNVRAFRDSLELTERQLALQNTALRNNISLLQQKRKSELEIAALQDNVELAGIAGQQLRGEISEGEAIEARAAIERRRIQRERDEKIAVASDQVLQAEEEFAAVRQVSVDSAKKLQENYDRLEELLKEETQLIKREIELRGEPTFDNIDTSDPAQITRAASADAERTQVAARLSLVSSELIPEARGKVDVLKQEVEDTNRQALDLAQNLDQVIASAEVTRQNADQSSELNTQLVDLNEQNSLLDENLKAQKEAVSEVSAGAKVLGQVIGQLGQERIQEAEVIANTMEIMQQALSDGELSVEELRAIGESMQQSNQSFAEATEFLGLTFGSHQRQINELREAVARALAAARRAGG